MHSAVENKKTGRALALSFSFSLALIGLAIALVRQAEPQATTSFTNEELRQAFNERDNVIHILIQKVTALEADMTILQQKREPRK